MVENTVRKGEVAGQIQKYFRPFEGGMLNFGHLIRNTHRLQISAFYHREMDFTCQSSLGNSLEL